MIRHIQKLYAHAAWADTRLVATLKEIGGDAEPEATREYAHIVGAGETWLSRLHGRQARLGVWPEATIAELEEATAEMYFGYAGYIGGLDEPDLDKIVAYTNSAGRAFETAAGDILLHVAMHAQYHRGKVNQLLRHAGFEPAPADFIAWVRGVAAATSGDPRARGGGA